MADQGGPGEVPGIFKQSNDKSQYKNLWDKHQKRTDPAENRIRHKISENTVADQRQDPATHANDAGLHRVHSRR